MKEIADTIENAKKHAIKYIKIPPHAKFEIRWAAEPPHASGEKQVLTELYEDSGPMLVACLTD